MLSKEFQQVAEIKIKEAQALFERRLYNGAYYLAGYAVECAFKACIARHVRNNELPDKSFVNDSYTHNFDKLLNISELTEEFKNAYSENWELYENWMIISEWTVDSRYQFSIDKDDAKDIIKAVNDEENGILIRNLSDFPNRNEKKSGLR